MVRLLASHAADVVRFRFDGLVVLAAGIVDAVAGQHLGSSLDIALVTAGVAALGLHLKDCVGV